MRLPSSAPLASSVRRSCRRSQDAGLGAVGFTLDRPLFVDGVRRRRCRQRAHGRVVRLAHQPAACRRDGPSSSRRDRDDLAEALAHFASWDRPPRVIAFSSGGTVYGPPAEPPFAETMEPAPVNEYGAAKLDLERQLADSGARDGVAPRGERLRPRPAPRAGPRRPRALDGGGPERRRGSPLRRPDRRRGTTCTSTTSRSAVVAAHRADAPPPVVNVGSGHPDDARQALGVSRVRRRARALRHVSATPRARPTPRHSTLDATLAREALGWSPTVSLDEGVAKMWHWRASQ